MERSTIPFVARSGSRRSVAETEPNPDFLLALRAVAGAFVVIFHVYTSGILNGSSLETLLVIGPLNLSWLLSGAGQAGVMMFFVLSGYLMGKGFFTNRYSLTLKGAGRFYWARFLRIYPMLAFFVLLVLTLDGSKAPSGAPTSLVVLRMFLTEWHVDWVNWFPKFGHLWSVFTEIRFYLLVPLFAYLMHRWAASPRHARIALGVFVLAGFAYRCVLWASPNPMTTDWNVVLLHWNDVLRQPLTSNLDLFLVGMLLNYARLTVPALTGRFRLGGFCFSLVCFYAVAAYVSHYAIFAESLLMKTAWAVGLPTLTIGAMIIAITLAEQLNNDKELALPEKWRAAVAIAAHCGTLTYGIYLWHLPFAAASLPFSRSLGWTANLVVNDVRTYLIAAIVAQVVHLGIELPTSRLRYRRTVDRTSVAARAVQPGIGAIIAGAQNTTENRKSLNL